jgi:hypothetical protein
MAKEKNADAKRAIIREWDAWSKSHPDDAKRTITAGMSFFTYLQKEKPELLNFQSASADKWQTIHGWLLRERRVKS